MLTRQGKLQPRCAAQLTFDLLPSEHPTTKPRLHCRGDKHCARGAYHTRRRSKTAPFRVKIHDVTHFHLP